MSGTQVTCLDPATGESETVTITDDHLVITDGRSHISSIVAYGNGTQVITIKKAETEDEARRFQAQVTVFAATAGAR